MLTEEQAEALRVDVKAAPPEDPVAIAYHAGDGRNRHDEWEADPQPMLDKDGKQRLDEFGQPKISHADEHGVERRKLVSSTFTDGGGDIDALAELYNAPSKVLIWTTASLQRIRATAVRYLGKLSLANGTALATLLSVMPEAADFAEPALREQLEEIFGKGTDGLAAMLELAQAPATRFQALCLAPDDGSGARTSSTPRRLMRGDVLEALYDDRGDSVVKR